MAERFAAFLAIKAAWRSGSATATVRGLGTDAMTRSIMPWTSLADFSCVTGISEVPWLMEISVEECRTRKKDYAQTGNATIGFGYHYLVSASFSKNFNLSLV